MLAQDRHEGIESTEEPAPKRQSRCPTKFMFIDSSNGGVNAKPDRVVRSFVMKSARNRKTWSTRPRSPKEGDIAEAEPLEQLHSPSNAQDESSSTTTSWLPQVYRKDSLWQNYAVISPASSRSGSVFSTYSGSYTCDSPLSCHTSPFADYGHTEHAHDISLSQQTAVAHHDGFDVNFSKPLSCLSVQLDAHMQLLLDQC